MRPNLKWCHYKTRRGRPHWWQTIHQLTLSIRHKKKKKKILNKTYDTWQVTLDTWHMTCDRWWTLCKNLRSLSLMVWNLWCFEDFEEKGHSLNQWLTRVFVEQPRLHPSVNYWFIRSVIFFLNKLWNTAQPKQLELGRNWNWYKKFPKVYGNVKWGIAVDFVWWCDVPYIPVVLHCTILQWPNIPLALSVH